MKRLFSLLLVCVALSSFIIPSKALADTATSTGGDASISTTIQCTCEYCEQIYAEVKRIQTSLESYVPAVTVVHSINNDIPKAYYKPKLKDIPMLEQKIQAEYRFVNAYTGEFDLSWNEEYKPDDTQSRALEILGYDFLLTNESYTNKDKYKATRVGSTLTKGTVIMDIYKALGIPQFDLYVFQEADDTITMENSPAAKGLPSYVASLNVSRAKTNVFTTRTNPDKYYAKALKDLNISKASMDDVMSYSEFNKLLVRMMKYYGEPVMNNTEMNQLLQVYGAEVPTYLSQEEADAYLYLKARGVLNIELSDKEDYMSDLSLDYLLDVLMCVKDDGSRTNYKEIKITMDIGDDLVNKGFFPRNVYLALGTEAVELGDVEYDYRKASYYDYYIKIDANTKFADSDGEELNYIFVPSTPNDTVAAELLGSDYVGTEIIDSVKYYHLQIPIIRSNSLYMKNSTEAYGKEGYIQLNSIDGEINHYLWLEQGGGIYTYLSKTDSAIALSRSAFKDGTFEGAVSIERKGNTEVEQSFLSMLTTGIMNLFSNTFVNAASTSATTNIISFTVYNVSDATYKEDIPNLEVTKDGSKWTVSLPISYKSVFLSSIKRNSSVEKVAYTAVANMSGNVLINYNELAEAGVFYNDGDTNPIPEAYNDQILVLNSSYGQITLNNETREVVVGNNVYRVKNDGSPLFKYVVKDGKSILWVDFRAAYGWSAGIVNTLITGTGSSYTINIEIIGTSSRFQTVNTAFVDAPKSFTTYTSTETMLVVPSKIVDDKGPKALATANYSLANWVIFQGINRSTGLTQDYAFIFYPKQAFEDYGLKAPNDIQKMTDILGYSIAIEDWACRVIPLTREPTTKAGMFTYTEGYGYVYNLPKWSDFTMKKYLKGDVCILPISYSGDRIINANVNYFSGYKYGSRPTNVNKVGVDIKGNQTTGTLLAVKTAMSAAPAGVSAFYGGAMRQYYEAGSNILGIKQIGNTNANVYYYGTTRCEVSWVSASKILLQTNFTNVYQYKKSYYVLPDQKFYKVKISTTGSNGNTNKAYRWVMYDDILTSSQSDLEDAEESSTIEIVDGEQKDRFTGNLQFTLQYILNLIDTGASLVIMITLQVIPYLCITGLTILVGMSFMSDSKVVRFIVGKTIDPVKYISLGNMTLEELSAKNSLLGLIFGYMGFALIMDGNILRIISWVMEYYTSLMELIRQI